MTTTIKTTYTCNLCNLEINEHKHGFGIKYRIEPQYPDSLVLINTSLAKTHICVTCAQSIHDELRKVIPAKINN